MDSKQKKKMIAPVAVTLLFLAYLVFYLAALIAMSDWNPAVFAIPLAALGAGMVFALRSRIKEIRSGEEDDLDNY